MTATATYRAPRPYTVRQLTDGRPNAWVVCNSAGVIVAAFKARKAAKDAARQYTHRVRAQFARQHPHHHRERGSARGD